MFRRDLFGIGLITAAVAVITVPFVRMMLLPPVIAEPVPRVRGDMHQIRSLVEMYRHVTGSYPSTEQGLDLLVNRPEAEEAIPNWKQLASEIPLDPWGSPYVYRWPGTIRPDTFDLISYGPDGVESKDDIRTPQ